MTTLMILSFVPQQHELDDTDLDLVAAKPLAALESMQHELDNADLDLVAAEPPQLLCVVNAA
jgi:hypothetical protein